MAVIPTLTDAGVVVRGIRTRDARELESQLLANRQWLQPWEATNPDGTGRWDVRGSIRSLLQQANDRTALPFVIEVDGRLVGQLTVSGMAYGALSSATLGYWVAQAAAGRGVATIATALATDHCLMQLGMHRMEICIRPENDRSLRVVQKLGFRYEGLRRRYIHIDGDWRDHFCFAVVREEVPFGVLARWRAGDADPSLAEVTAHDVELSHHPMTRGSR
ncbi:GNAT family N-acetyltransferase [Pseudoclavibacter chungangensis]|uniref:GNAT family N-acetyltransferase n=1 Tax=Pseudoclavibacter chungangensis TaxID=587635 RepID=A0A7J5C0J1_9MICO|nr:GNAT family protein [Pseudoclavibacter chungangensis]KAB1660407.1 GNAT family N-acetyltransferase [Pseudoclavibacter chungangensis]NYJ65773.1 ribosomal-protein-alanine N-acetyltransferase [Pseudoclavibacter chungangensis]